jgi:hypothetical protein
MNHFIHPCRKHTIANGKHLKSIINFTDQQVFRGATTYTAIQVLTKEPNLGGVAVGRFTDLHDGDAQCAALDSGRSMEGITAFVARSPSNDEPWSFVSASLQNWCEDLARDRLTLIDVASVFVGVQTSADDIYHFDFVSGDKKVVHVKSRRDDSVYQLEAEVLHPLISGTDVRPYVLDKDRQVILFPYWWDSQDERRLISEPVFNERFPLAWAYLKRHEKSLRTRENSSFDIESWYQFGRSQNIGRQRGKKICIPRLAERIRCAVDEQGNCCLDNVDVNGVRIRKKFADSLHPLLLVAVLNSTLSDSFVRANGGTHFRGGFASFNRQFIEAIPICVPKKGIERKIASRIVGRVKEVTDTKSKLVDAQISGRERERLEREVEAHEKRIDELVCELYGVKEIPE